MRNRAAVDARQLLLHAYLCWCLLHLTAAPCQTDIIQYTTTTHDG
jgi:hypothetical protein